MPKKAGLKNNTVGKTFIPLVRPSLGVEEYEAVRSCLSSGWITTGPKVATFEKALRQHFNTPYVLALSSNTAGLYLALRALEIGAGDEVITSPLTFAATANVIEMTGAKTIFCDIDPVTRNICLDSLPQKITKQTRALLPVHMYGLPLNSEKLYSIAQAYSLRVVEDAAHVMGATSKKGPVGSFGDTQVFSFHANKNITTGEGGCFVTRDENLFQKVKALHFHGFDRSAWDRFQKKGKGDYDIIAPGLKFNMMDLQAGIGLCQIKKMHTLQQRRRYIAHRYLEELAGVKNIEMPEKAPNHCWHLFSPLVHFYNLKCTRAEFTSMLKEKNIGTGIHYRPLHSFSYYAKKYKIKKGAFPEAEKVGASTISLPLFPDLSENEQDYVIKTLKDLLEKYQND